MCQNVKILEKIARCARLEDTGPDQYRDSAVDNGKSEDSAKMTHSIHDFVSRNGFNLPIYCQYLPLERGNTPIQYLESLETILRTFLSTRTRHARSIPCPACVAAAFAREKDFQEHRSPSSCLTHCPSHQAHSTLCAECARQEKIGGRLLSRGHRSDISHDVVVSVSDTVTQDGVLVASGAGSRRLRLRE